MCQASKLKVRGSVFSDSVPALGERSPGSQKDYQIVQHHELNWDEYELEKENEVDCQAQKNYVEGGLAKQRYLAAPVAVRVSGYLDEKFFDALYQDLELGL